MAVGGADAELRPEGREPRLLRLPPPVGEHDGRPVRVERPRHPAAEPAGRAGDEHPPPGEVEMLRLDPGHYPPSAAIRRWGRAAAGRARGLVRSRAPLRMFSPFGRPPARGLSRAHKGIPCSPQRLNRDVEAVRAGMTAGRLPNDEVGVGAATTFFPDGAAIKEWPCPSTGDGRPPPCPRSAPEGYTGAVDVEEPARIALEDAPLSLCTTDRAR